MVNHGKYNSLQVSAQIWACTLLWLIPNMLPTTRRVAIVSTLRLGPDKPPVSIGGLQTMYLVVTSREDVMIEGGWHHVVAQ